MTPIVFYILAVLTVGSALLMVTRRNPIASALWLVVCFFVFAALYVTLSAHFIAVLQVLLYAGAIMVLFVFVIMLLNFREEEIKDRVLQFSGLLGGSAAIYFLVLLSLSLLRGKTFAFEKLGSNFGTVKEVGMLLFTRYLVPFELTSILLLVAIVGSVVMGKRKL